MTKHKCTKAVAYIRASTEKQELSPLVQRERIEAYCKLMGLQLVETITEHVSARVKLAKRPEGAKLAALIKSGVCHVVALKLDRLFRNAADALVTVEQWHDAGIHLHLVDMGGMTLNSASSMGKMFLTMLAGFAEFERNVISERTSAALRLKKAHGEVYGRGVYGFDPVDGKLIENAGEQAVLKRIKSLRADEVSYHGIADALNADGVPSKTGGLWHGFTIQKMLRNAEPGNKVGTRANFKF